MASYDARELRVNQNYLVEYGGFSLCETYQYGRQLLADLEAGAGYDLLWLDEELRDMDVKTFTAAFYSMDVPCKPMLLVSASGRPGKNPAPSLHPGPNYCIIKPYELREVSRELRVLCSMQEQNVQDFCEGLYEEWDLLRTGRDRDYLTEAVGIALRSAQKLFIRKEILLPIAERHAVSVDAVDSGIRRVLKELEQQGRPAWRSFKEQFGPPGRKLKPGDFIYAIRAAALWDEQEGGACFHDQTTDECPAGGG